MLRKLLLAATLGLFATGTVALAADDKKDEKTDDKAAAVDKEKVFAKLDADSDGKISKDEFKAAREQMAEKLKERAGGKGGKFGDMAGTLFQKMFEKLDADGDGSITKDEFVKSDIGGAMGGKLSPEKLKELKEKLGGGKRKRDGK